MLNSPQIDHRRVHQIGSCSYLVHFTELQSTKRFSFFPRDPADFSQVWCQNHKPQHVRVVRSIEHALVCALFRLCHESPLQTSCSSSESGDSEPKADTSRDKHIEFMRIAFRAKQPQQPDSARIKTNSAKPSATFLTPSRPHSSMHQENTSTASKRTPGSTGRTPGSAGRTSESAGPAKDRSHEMSAGGEHHSSGQKKR